MNAALADVADAETTWPGVLFVETPGSVEVELFRVAGLSEGGKRDLALRRLPSAVRQRGAVRFCWAMPAWRHDEDGDREVLVLVFAERGGRFAVSLADVEREPQERPRLGAWYDLPLKADGGGGGLFVEPLLAALEPRRRRVG